MSLDATEWIYHDGRWCRWAEATVHVTAHALHYGSSVFEGIRAYETAEGSAIFRLEDHLRRLFNSARLLRLETEELDPAELARLCVELVRRNRHRACYLRPLLYRDTGTLGLYAAGQPVGLTLLSIEWGEYLGQDAVENGVDAAISSWRRPSPGSYQPLGKIGGQYVQSQLVSAEARENGFGEGIVLDDQGTVAEGAGENLFLVFDGEIVTPPLGTSILAGITRDTVIRLARDRGIPLREAVITRDMLYLCDELFMTGTAAEVTPVRSVDRIPIGEGGRGAITRQLQDDFFRLVRGETDDPYGWLTPVNHIDVESMSA